MLRPPNRSHREKGQNLVEYGMLFALIALVVILAVTFFGSELSQTVHHIGTVMQSWGSGGQLDHRTAADSHLAVWDCAQVRPGSAERRVAEGLAGMSWAQGRGDASAYPRGIPPARGIGHRGLA